jgi:hypothetical protein
MSPTNCWTALPRWPLAWISRSEGRPATVLGTPAPRPVVDRAQAASRAGATGAHIINQVDLVSGLIGAAVGLAIAIVSIARENRYRFVDRKMLLYTDLVAAAEDRFDAIRWQREGQASAAESGMRLGDIQLREIGPGTPMEHARSAIRLVTDDQAVDTAAEALLVAASDLGQGAYVAPVSGALIPPPRDPDNWKVRVDKYTAAHDVFSAHAKGDLESTGQAWIL